VDSLWIDMASSNADLYHARDLFEQDLTQGWLG